MRRICSLLAALLCCGGMQAEPAPEKRICVPSEGGETWECGTVDNPPPPRGLPVRAERGAAADPPPFFLADPAYRAEAAQETNPASTATKAEPLDPAVEQEPATATYEAEAVQEIEPATAEAAALASDLTAQAPQDKKAFLVLAANRYTIQLSRDADPTHLQRVAAQLGLAAQSLYLVDFPAPGGRQWLLLWSEFPDYANAKAAAGALPRDLLGNAVWPRRIGPLQQELVR